MLQRDYFIRIIEEFTAALARFLEKKEGEQRQRYLEDLYRQYVGDYTLLRNFTVDEAFQYALDQWKPEERVDRLEMLAELYFVEGKGKQNPLRDMLLQKAYSLFDYVDGNSQSFSLSRQQKMAEINRLLSK